MKRLLTLLLCLSLLCPAASAAEGEASPWSRTERVPCPQGDGLDWA